MKNNRITPKAKRAIIIAGVAVLCIGVAAAVLPGHVNANAADESSGVSSDKIIMVSNPDISVPEIKKESIASSATPSSSVSKTDANAETTSKYTTASKPASTPPKPVYDGSSSELTDKTKKPKYKKTPKAPSSSKSAVSSKPTGGKKGQVYDPVFGWSYPTGGEGTTVDGDWGGGSQVGIMD